MKKKESLHKVHSLNRSLETNLPIPDNICLIDLEELKEHEEIRPDYLEELKNEILSDGILKMPIAVDKKTYIILDGHHRLHALKKIGCKRIPVILFDYQAPEIEVHPHREGETVTKEMIIRTALAGRRMPPKTSKHMILIEGELKHISVLETVINVPLERLR
jgi:L-serine kinase (ADP)